MANVTITIPSPVLAVGEKFKTRYRKLPNGAFTSYVDRTNAPFTLSGLDDGADYVLEIIFVEADATECPARYEYFTTTIAGDCPLFSAEIGCDNNIAFLQLDYTYPSPYTAPPCGFVIEITQNGVTTTINKPSGLNIIGQEIFTLSSSDSATVIVKANLCNGQYRECYAQSLMGVECDCTGMIIISTSITFIGGAYPWFIQINYTNSNPATPFTKVTYNQTNTVTSGVPDSGFQNFPTPIGPSGHGFKVKANMNGNFEIPSYTGTIIDGCGNVIPWSV